MAGAVGIVKNTSPFASFVVKDWQAWMTEAVILHASGMSIPELRVRFSRTDAVLRNILNTEQAKGIVRDLQSKMLKTTVATATERIENIRSKALENMEKVLNDEDGALAKTSPFAFLEASRKVYETVTKQAPSAPQPISVQQNIQNNILNGVSPEVLQRLRGGPTLTELDVPENVEYLGHPPTREGERELHDGGNRGVEGQSKTRLALVMPNSTPSAQR